MVSRDCQCPHHHWLGSDLPQFDHPLPDGLVSANGSATYTLGCSILALACCWGHSARLCWVSLFRSCSCSAISCVDTMGLDWASMNGDMPEQLRWYLQYHLNRKQIKVLCISGRSLFRETLDGTDPPLTKWARLGRLDVVMPVSSESNQRSLKVGTYSETFKKTHYPNGKRDLVNEVEAGKTFLRGFAKTTRCTNTTSSACGGS